MPSTPSGLVPYRPGSRLDRVVAGLAPWTIEERDNLETMRGMPDRCCSAVVTDPPGGTGFMQEGWDGDRGGRDRWIGWLAERMAEARRVCVPGAMSITWSFPRTSHWTGMAIEDAGWFITAQIIHLFAQGRPVPPYGLKPAAETWWVAQAPLGGTREEDRAAWGTGGLQIEAARQRPQGEKEYGLAPARWPCTVVCSHAPGCRRTGVAAVPGDRRRGGGKRPAGFGNVGADKGDGRPCSSGYAGDDGLERFEAWECVEGCPARELDLQAGVRKSGAYSGKRRADRERHAYGSFAGTPEGRGSAGSEGPASRYFPQFAADMEALELESRFVYATKVRGRKRDIVLPDGTIRRNSHPTVKNVYLCDYLCALACPPGGLVLDPFAGTGSIGVAALRRGMRYLGCENDAEHDPRFAEVARWRLSRPWAGVGGLQERPGAAFGMEVP